MMSLKRKFSGKHDLSTRRELSDLPFLAPPNQQRYMRIKVEGLRTPIMLHVEYCLWEIHNEVT